MSQAIQLNLNLNYAHKNVSSAFRISSGLAGAILIIIGTFCIINTGNQPVICITNAIANIIVGIIAVVLSTNYLPGFAKRFFIVTDKYISYKTTYFFGKKTIYWDTIEQIEIDHQTLRIVQETSHKDITIYLGIVSYNDFELLNKAIVDTCLRKDIDLR